MGHRLTSCMSRGSSSKQCQCRRSTEFDCGSEISEQAAESKHADDGREEQSCSMGNRLASCMSQSASPEWGWHRRLVGDYCKSEIKEQPAASKGTGSSREEQRCPMGNTLISCMSPSASPVWGCCTGLVEPDCRAEIYEQVAASKNAGSGREEWKLVWHRRSVEPYPQV